MSNVEAFQVAPTGTPFTQFQFQPQLPVATSVTNAGAGAGSVLETLVGLIPSVVLPLPGYPGPLNNGHRNFAVWNPHTGATTHFISMPGQSSSLGGLTLTPVETITYRGGEQPPVREFGFGTTVKRGDLSFFCNLRAGDLRDLREGKSKTVSFNFGVMAAPRVLQDLVRKQAGSLGPRLRPLAALLGGQIAGNLVGGLAWRAQISLNDGKLVVTLPNRQTIELTELMSALGLNLGSGSGTDGREQLNYGDPRNARANVVEAWLTGANPYDESRRIRDANDGYRNYGDHALLIANLVNELAGRAGFQPPRTNAEVGALLHRLIRDSTWERSRSGHERTWEALDQLLELIHSYDLGGLYGPTVQGALAGRPPADRPSDFELVRGVYQGNFRQRHINESSFGSTAANIVLGLLKLPLAILLNDFFHPKPTADGEMTRINARRETLRQRWNDHHDGTAYFGVPPDRGREAFAILERALYLTSRINNGHPGATGAELYTLYQGLPAEVQERIREYVRDGALRQ